MTLRVTVLGCSGSYAAVDNACTGYLVQSEHRNVLLDCGPGTLANLQRHLPVGDLDAVVITHCHPDHWVELPVLRNVWQWVVRRRGLPVYTTSETWSMLVTVAHGHPGDAFSPTIVRSGDDLMLKDQRWRFSLTDHPVETHAVRVDTGDRSFAFSADTGPGWSLEALGHGIDLVFCESTFSDATLPPDGAPHLTARQAGASAAAAGAARLVLTHLLPGEDPAAHLAEASEVFDRPLSIAKIHERYDA
jgi:ribonuclease BN (tRNA processing enzyme)